MELSKMKMCVLLCTMVLFQCLGASAAISLKSAKPQYAKIAVIQDGSKVLSIVFDESKGTGTGYDTLYADSNFDGRFDESERVHTSVRGETGGPISSQFLLTSAVPFSSKIRGGIVMELDYSKLPLAASSVASEQFSLLAECPSVKGQMTAELKISPTLAGAAVVAFGKPVVQVGWKPDSIKPGNTYIAMILMLGDWTYRYSCPVKLTIRDGHGKIVHQVAADMGKFVFG